MLFTAAQHTNDPSKEDDGDCHANEASRHSPQIWARVLVQRQVEQQKEKKEKVHEVEEF